MLFVNVKCRSIPTIIKYRANLVTMVGMKYLLTRVTGQTQRNAFHTTFRVSNNHLRSNKRSPRLQRNGLIPIVNTGSDLDFT